MSDLASRVEGCCGVALETLPSRTRQLLAERLDGADPDRAREIIVGLVSVGETMFHRHGPQLDALREVLASRPPRGRPARVWSAGCASGEEVYTLAALFCELGLPADVLGTDVNQASLARARRARYGPWSLRRVPPAWTARWLRLEGREVTVAPALREGARFEVLDLSRDPFPARQDLIACRNVLIYFSPRAREAVFAKFAAALEPDGLLLLAPSDPPPPAGWAPVGDVVGLYRRGDAPARSKPSQPEARRPRRPAKRAPASAPIAAPPSPAGPAPAVAPAPTRSETAWSLAGRGEHVAALESLAAALDEQPLAVELWVQRAMIAEEAGQVDVATDAARRACLLAPSAAAPNAWLGSCLRAQGEEALAANRFKLARRALVGAADDEPVPYTDGMSAADLRRLLAALGDGSEP